MATDSGEYRKVINIERSGDFKAKFAQQCDQGMILETVELIMTPGAVGRVLPAAKIPSSYY